MNNFILPFNLKVFNDLDGFAFSAQQPQNLGDNSNWFYYFRGGIHGLYARIHGVKTHFYEVHAWYPRIRLLIETEYHLSSIFFNMDSAIECFVFALNALGNAIAPKEFLDVTNDAALREVALRNIIEPKPLPGYSLFFPTLQEHWRANQDVLNIITEQHDVSKHRHTIFHGGQARLDPPPGFYEKLGIDNNPNAQADFWPMAEIILQPEPKVPLSKCQSPTQNNTKILEPIAETFCEFINTTCIKAYQDATQYIKLPSLLKTRL
jgi:hypothetical protein